MNRHKVILDENDFWCSQQSQVTTVNNIVLHTMKYYEIPDLECVQHKAVTNAQGKVSVQ